MRKRSRILISCLAAIGLSAAASGADGASGFFRPAAGARLQAGGNVEVSWTTPPSGSATFDEMELVLSLDGGRTFPIRVTADVSRAAGRISWRVPAVVSEHARLALRTGLDEQADSEVVRFLGPEFAVTPETGDPLEVFFWVQGEWRTREALAPSSPVPFEASLDGTPADQMSGAPEASRAFEPPRSLAAPACDEATRKPAAEPAHELAASLTRLPRPLTIPLRQ